MIGSIKKAGKDLFFKAINEHNVHEVVALLADNEVDVDDKNVNGQTPLLAAVQAQNSTIINILI